MGFFRLMFSRRWWWTTLFVIAGIGLTVRLGLWQVDRYHKNKAVADHMAAIQTAAPLTLSGEKAPVDLIAQEYRPVTAAGTYDFAHQVAIRNQIWQQSWGNDIGFILITPLVFPDGSSVLVDRGWIPEADDTAASWAQFDQPGQVTVTGIIRLPTRPEYNSIVEPALAPGESIVRLWNLVDIADVQKQVPYPLLPIYIQQAPDPSFTTMPYRSQSEPDPGSADTNVGYAFTWFAFAALLFGGYPVYLRTQSIEKSK